MGVKVDTTKIVELREKFGISQEELANRSGCSHQTIYRMEAGKNVWKRSVKAVAAAFTELDDNGVYDADDLIDRRHPTPFHAKPGNRTSTPASKASPERDDELKLDQSTEGGGSEEEPALTDSSKPSSATPPSATALESDSNEALSDRSQSKRTGGGGSGAVVAEREVRNSRSVGDRPFALIRPAVRRLWMWAEPGIRAAGNALAQYARAHPNRIVNAAVYGAITATLAGVCGFFSAVAASEYATISRQGRGDFLESYVAIAMLPAVLIGEVLGIAVGGAVFWFWIRKVRSRPFLSRLWHAFSDSMLGVILPMVGGFFVFGAVFAIISCYLISLALPLAIVMTETKGRLLTTLFCSTSGFLVGLVQAAFVQFINARWPDFFDDLKWKIEDLMKWAKRRLS